MLVMGLRFGVIAIGGCPSLSWFERVRVDRPQASKGTAIEYYAAVDMSLELSSVCVVDGTDKIVRETNAAGERRR